MTSQWLPSPLRTHHHALQRGHIPADLAGELEVPLQEELEVLVPRELGQRCPVQRPPRRPEQHGQQQRQPACGDSGSAPSGHPREPRALGQDGLSSQDHPGGGGSSVGRPQKGRGNSVPCIRPVLGAAAGGSGCVGAGATGRVGLWVLWGQWGQWVPWTKCSLRVVWVRWEQWGKRLQWEQRELGVLQWALSTHG